MIGFLYGLCRGEVGHEAEPEMRLLRGGEGIHKPLPDALPQKGQRKTEALQRKPEHVH
jgi:hypothetical protein